MQCYTVFSLSERCFHLNWMVSEIVLRFQKQNIPDDVGRCGTVPCNLVISEQKSFKWTSKKVIFKLRAIFAKLNESWPRKTKLGFKWVTVSVQKNAQRYNYKSTESKAEAENQWHPGKQTKKSQNSADSGKSQKLQSASLGHGEAWKRSYESPQTLGKKVI